MAMFLARESVPASLWLALAVLSVGCMKPVPHPAEGLRPLPLLMAKESLERRVESCQPRLEWESFPRPWDVQLDKAARLARAADLTYELKIWRAEGRSPGGACAPPARCDFPAELIYERKGLTEATHEVEAPLEPNQLYLWTVRARFLLDGQPRVTPWAVLLATERDQSLPARRSTVIPSAGYYSFATPDR